EIIGRFSTGSGNFDYIHPRSDGSFLADGRIRLRILQEALDEDEFNSDADRLSGYIMEMLERLPVVGDTVQTDQYSYTVLRMREKRIRVVQIRKIEPDLDNLAAQEAK
ncbi:MAG: transporter associated domain-containing protein, partial [Lentisphaeria bacterium]